MRNLPPLYDATPLIKALAKRPETKVVSRQLQQLLDVSSAHTDLIFAREMLATLALDLQGEFQHGSPYPNAVRGALLAQAILLYARAVVVKNDHRSRFEILPSLSDQQRSAHNRIKELRHQAIAHFNRDAAHYSTPFANERIIVPGSDPLRLVVVTNRLAIDVTLINELIDLNEAAIKVLDRIRAQKSEEATDGLAAAMIHDRKIFEDLTSNATDVLELVENFDLASDMLGPGHMSGQMHDGPRVE